MAFDEDEPELEAKMAHLKVSPLICVYFRRLIQESFAERHSASERYQQDEAAS